MGRSDEELNRRDNKRARSKAARSRRAASAGAFDITAIAWLPLVALVELLAANGGAVRIGLTRDGGALALGVYLEDDYATEYIRPAENFEAAIEEVARAWLPHADPDYTTVLQRVYQRSQPR